MPFLLPNLRNQFILTTDGINAYHRVSYIQLGNQGG